jgi:agmatinase
MKPNEMQSSQFLGSRSRPEENCFCLLGVPLDITASFRPGTRRGPQAIRQASWTLEEFSLYQERHLKEVHFCDLGDLSLPTAGLQSSLAIIQTAVEELVQTDLKPFILGGEHLLTLPVVKALTSVYGSGLIVLQFDAHADLRDQYEGEALSHATVMRRLAELITPGQIYQFGIRSATVDELAYARRHTNFYPFQVLEPLARVLPSLQNRPLYVSIDIDVFDPAFAPGVGTPEPGGVTVATLLAALKLLQGHNIVGVDIVEACPPFDPSERTAVLAALLVRELLLLAD